MRSSPRIRVCQVVSNSADSEYFRNLGLGIANKGIGQFWVTLFESGREMPKWMESAQGIDFLCLGVRGRFGFPLAAARLTLELSRRKIDVIQTHLYEASLVGLFAAKLARTPVKILTRHHLDQAILIGRRIPMFLDKWEARTSDHIVTLGGAVKEHLIGKEGVPSEKVNVVYQGFDFDRFSATEAERAGIRMEFGYDETDFVVGTFGNFFPTKGHNFLLSAVKQLKARFPAIQVLFVGDGGDKEATIRMVDEMDLGDRVSFAGFRKDVAACMKACDLVVHPSLSEAFCQVLIESMSVGTPLVSTDVGGAREVIEHGATGTLVPAADVEAISNAIESVLLDRDRAENMAEVGKRYVQERFTIRNMIETQCELYRRWTGRI